MASNSLIVDDDKSVREILKDVLDEAGYSTVLAASAEKALETWENYRPDVVVSDVWMPSMDGHEFCKIVRDTSDALILMMSGVCSEFSVLQRKQNAGESPLDDELRMLRMFKRLSGAQKELFLKEAERMAEAA